MCGALAKGTSRSRDTQHLTTAFHILSLHLRCRIWIEWVPSESSPADLLSREKAAPFDFEGSRVVPMKIPCWANQAEFDSISKILDTIEAERAFFDLSPDPGSPSQEWLPGSFFKWASE